MYSVDLGQIKDLRASDPWRNGKGYLSPWGKAHREMVKPFLGNQVSAENVTIATSPSINNLDIAPIERLLCCGIFDHTVKLGGYVNKINLESGGRVSNQLTRINHREYRGPRKTDREMHRK